MYSKNIISYVIIITTIVIILEEYFLKIRIIKIKLAIYNNKKYYKRTYMIYIYINMI